LNLGKTHLVELLCTFDQYDWNGLKKFLHSPFHNQREDVKKLFEYFKNVIQIQKKIANLDEEAAYQAIFGNGVYRAQSLRYTVSFLYQLTRKYFQHRAMDERQLQLAPDFLDYLKHQNLNRLIRKEVNAASSEIKNQERIDQEVLFAEYLLEKERHFLQQQRDRNDTIHLIKASSCLDWHFCLEKLRLLAPLKVHQVMTHLILEDPFIDPVMNFVEQKLDQSPPVVRIYFLACQIFDDWQGDEKFITFKNELAQNTPHLKLSHLKECFTLGINYCIRKINSGDRDYVEEVLDLYQSGLEGKAFFENGYLSRFTYKNIITAALGLGRFEWAQAFIEQYKQSLDPRYREDAYRYNLAILKYKLHDFDGTQELLRDLDFEDLFFNLNARLMLLKIFYESELWNALDSHLDSFKVFIYRHRELGYQKKHYLNLIRFTRKLLKLPQLNNQQRSLLKSKIQSENMLAEKNWLLEKIF
jgi:hypothetical protein